MKYLLVATILFLSACEPQDLANSDKTLAARTEVRSNVINMCLEDIETAATESGCFVVTRNDNEQRLHCPNYMGELQDVQDDLDEAFGLYTNDMGTVQTRVQADIQTFSIGPNDYHGLTIRILDRRITAESCDSN